MENIKLEDEQIRDLNILLNQAQEFNIKLDVYKKAATDVQEQAEAKMTELRDYYDLNGQAFQYNPQAGELVIVEEEATGEEEISTVDVINEEEVEEPAKKRKRGRSRKKAIEV
jgi:hypothetical protein